MTRAVEAGPPTLPSTRLRPSTAPAARPAARPASVDRFVPVNAKALVEADLRLSLKGSTAATAEGTIRLQRPFIEHLTRTILRNIPPLSDERITFDAARGLYRINAKVDIKGFKVPIEATGRPALEKGMIALKFEDLKVPIGGFGLQNRFASEKAIAFIADEIRKSGFTVETDLAAKTIRLEPNRLLHHKDVNVLPSFFSFDTARTATSLKVEPNGDLSIDLHAKDKGPAIPRTPFSDLSLAADQKALEQLLGQALSPQFEETKVRLRDGGLTLEGKVDAKPLSDIVTTGKNIVLLALALLNPGSAGAAENAMGYSKVRIPLELDVVTQGTTLRIKPSLTEALADLENTLKGAGLKPQTKNGVITVDIAPVLTNNHARLDDLTFKRQGLSAKARLDIDALTGDVMKWGAP